MIDAKKSDLIYIDKIIKKYVPDCEIWVFGSRINGKARHYSDIDIAIIADRSLDWLIIENIKDEFANSDILYRVDVHDYHAISDSFKKLINENHKVLT